MEITLLTNPNSATIGKRIPLATNWNKLLGSPNFPDRKWKGHGGVSWFWSEVESLKVSQCEILTMVKISAIFTIDILAKICALILFNLIAIDVFVNIKKGS